MATGATRFSGLGDIRREVRKFQPGEAFLAKAMEDPAGVASDLGSVSDRLFVLIRTPSCCGKLRAQALQLRSSVAQMLRQLEYQLDPNPVW